jgi:hypothetical protein
MNERIKELMDQAGIDVEVVENLGEMPTALKFAQLIVEECCNRLGEETILHDGYGYNQHELYNRLRKHFGVEL